MTVDSNRKKALDAALSQINKQFGKGSAMMLGERPKIDVEIIPSGSLALDKLLVLVVIQEAELLKFMVQKVLVKLL